jgi:hypothetical protein
VYVMLSIVDGPQVVIASGLFVEKRK